MVNMYVTCRDRAMGIMNSPAGKEIRKCKGDWGNMWLILVFSQAIIEERALYSAGSACLLGPGTSQV